MPFRPTDPVRARQIAEHAAMVLTDIRRSLSLEQLWRIHRDWESFAIAAGVTSQIRDHVRRAANEVSVGLKAKRVVRNPTGEAA